MFDRLIVGFDGSPTSLNALEWAAEEAVLRNATVDVIASIFVPTPYVMWPYSDRPPFDVDGASAEAAADLERAAAHVVSRHPGLHVRTKVLIGPPADVLSFESKTADVAVVGTTGHRRLEYVLLGSTAHALARSSACPVAMIPPTSERARTGRIVAGTDGSEHSDAALDWAVAEAERRNAELFVVHAWFYPYSEFSSEDMHDRTRVDASLVLGTAVDRCTVHTAIPVHGELVEGSAAPALIAAGSDADMIVLGSRGQGRFHNIPFGSVARTVAEHARCAIVVIRPPGQ